MTIFDNSALIYLERNPVEISGVVYSTDFILEEEYPIKSDLPPVAIHDLVGELKPFQRAIYLKYLQIILNEQFSVSESSALRGIGDTTILALLETLIECAGPQQTILGPEEYTVVTDDDGLRERIILRFINRPGDPVNGIKIYKSSDYFKAAH